MSFIIVPLSLQIKHDIIIIVKSFTYTINDLWCHLCSQINVFRYNQTLADINTVVYFTIL